jgi:hypothetical protein
LEYLITTCIEVLIHHVVRNQLYLVKTAINKNALLMGSFNLDWKKKDEHIFLMA